MEMKINIPEWKCENLLAMKGYVSEKITAFYAANETPYDNGVDINNLKSVEIKIAYPKYDRPEELGEKYPMLDNLQRFEYSEVVNKLFNSILWNALMKV